jgi:hypothetical protein
MDAATATGTGLLQTASFTRQFNVWMFVAAACREMSERLLGEVMVFICKDLSFAI